MIHTWERTYQYIKKAGTVILGISILLWALMTFPGLPDEKTAYFEQQRQAVMATATTAVAGEIEAQGEELSEQAAALAQQISGINNAENEARLQNSIAGKLGSSLEPLTRLAGFEWRTNIALIGGFAAKEVIVSTLGTAYSMGEMNDGESESLGKRLQNDNAWNRVVAVAALVFIMFYAPCFVTVVCIAKESSWKWAFFSITFNTVFAFAMAVVIYQVGMFFNLG
jgi:ferrous iron transport protein B